MPTDADCFTVSGGFATNNSFSAADPGRLRSDPGFYVAAMQSVFWRTGKNAGVPGSPGHRIVSATLDGAFTVTPPMPNVPQAGDEFRIG